MGDYTKGKIYKIVPNEIEIESDIYIGSTTKEYLSQRMATHKVGYLHWKKSGEGYLSVFDLFEKYGFDTCKIILLENVSCKSKDELCAVENKYIHDLKCINILGRKAYEKQQRKELIEEQNIKANEYDQVLNGGDFNVDIKPKTKIIRKKAEFSEEKIKARNEHLAQARVKAAETKRKQKENRLKAENLDNLKIEMKAKEYDELKNKVSSNVETCNKQLEYVKMIEIFEKRYNKSLLEIFLEYEDFKKS
jgi:hypothetical protein